MDTNLLKSSNPLHKLVVHKVSWSRHVVGGSVILPFKKKAEPEGTYKIATHFFTASDEAEVQVSMDNLSKMATDLMKDAWMTMHLFVSDDAPNKVAICMLEAEDEWEQPMTRSQIEADGGMKMLIEQQSKTYRIRHKETKHWWQGFEGDTSHKVGAARLYLTPGLARASLKNGIGRLKRSGVEKLPSRHDYEIVELTYTESAVIPV